MNLEIFLTYALLVAGAAIMLWSIKNNQAVFRHLALITGEDKQKLSNRLVLLNALMIFFLVCYLGVIALISTSSDGFSNLAFGVILFSGSLFVLFTVDLNTRFLANLTGTLEGIIPMCAWCKKVRHDIASDGDAEWISIEAYLDST